ncbi:unnamed protein product [Notodromas monacha]|uniref:cystathionine gamma-lyase n=1 Tax=Notodromas monacha TaxID=399045 RepID=A0A7R9G9D1_9CRUS|nr:unnamed protein product [Notodromas monacha]CAG0912739.1 unnamed protein product [Notodromas monacha]
MLSANNKQDSSFETKAIHVANDPEQWKSKAVVPLISLATVFKHTAPGHHAGFEYSRGGNPTRQCMESTLASLEQGKYGIAFASGIGAVLSVCQLMNTGDHLVTQKDLYFGSIHLFQEHLPTKCGIEVTFLDLTNEDRTELKASLRPKTKMIWIETPTNPILKIIDIKTVAEIAHEHNPDIIVVVDNTFASPYFQNPLQLGADVVVHSLSKYVSGHSDVIMGAAITNSDKLHKEIRELQNDNGVVPSPFDCYLVSRSLRTLALRMAKHESNALAVAKHLLNHPLVSWVSYPGLPNHPQHDLASRQMYGFSGIVAAKLKHGSDEKVLETFLKNFKIFTHATSLGGVESLVSSPGLMIKFSSVPEKEERLRLGIDDEVIRFSVGIESVDDLIQDIDAALQATLEVLEQ